MDFDQLAETAPDIDPTDPFALYDSLDRKQTHVELRPVQRSVLTLWQARRGERDVVVKLPTGSGKTTVGLLMLASYMRESGRPTLYLCPTNQLVEQVVQEGERCGVGCCLFGEGAHPPPEAQSAEKVLVTSVQKLFNAKTVFGRGNTPFEPHALLMDDAHAALEIIRKQFTISMASKDELFKQLFRLFSPILHEQSPGLFASLEAGDSHATIEVPYWHWMAKLNDVARMLAEAAGDAKTTVGLTWGMVRDHLQAMRCVFSGTSAEITPEMLPVSVVHAYAKADHRIFMSATLSDEAALVRELDCSPQSASSPLEPSGVGGPGERMVLVPGLMASGNNVLSRDSLMTICRDVSSKRAVVVIAPSDRVAKTWAAVKARVVTRDNGDSVAAAVNDLRDGKSRFVVFSNRYDGIDLPDDACRLLVLDGAPSAYYLLDAVDGAPAGGASVRQRTVVQRIEQGLGRAVRTPVDYAAVILWGNDLVSLISDKAVRAGMSEETRLQIELGLTIAKQAKSEGNPTRTMTTLINQCLDRDSGWKKFYGQKVKAQVRPVDAATRGRRIEYASLERAAWQDFIANRGNDAGERIQRYINGRKAELADEEQAWLLQRAAWYSHSFSPEHSLIQQRAAHERNPRMLRPPKGVRYPKHAAKLQSQGAATLLWYRRFELGLGAVAAFNEMRAHLVFSPDASSTQFEEALMRLGTVLGFQSNQPERDWGIGPDVLWLFGQTVMPLEAKNQVLLSAEAISKDNAGQLTQSTAWAKETYGERESLVPLLVHPSNRAGDNAFPPEGTRVIQPADLKSLLDATEGLVALLATKSGEQWEAPDVERLLIERQLVLPRILSTYTKPILR